MERHGHRLGAIASAVGGELRGATDRWIDHLSVDTRKALPREGALFIALKGPHHDGHRYVQHAFTQGIRDFLLTDASVLPAGANAIVVRDAWDALHRLAAWHRGHFHLPVVGITGSNGKTVVKEWLFQLLGDKEHIVRSPGSWNSRLGVPLSVWELGREHTLGIFEAGISHPGEMDALRPIVHPTIGIFTNLGPAHGEHFKNDAEKAAEKAKLFRDARTLVYCRDHEVVHNAIVSAGLDQQGILRDWSRERSAYVHLVNEQHRDGGTALRLLHDHRELNVHLPQADAASVENAMQCITLLLHLGHDPEWIAERVRRLRPLDMRLRSLAGVHDSTIIDDAYSNDLASLAIALDHLAAVAGGRERIVVLSDIEESAQPGGDLCRRVNALLVRAGVTKFIGVGPVLSAHAHLLPGGSVLLPDAAELLAGRPEDSVEGAVVLVKGARHFSLERLVERLQEKAHGTVLEVDLDAVRHNLNHYRTKLTPGTRIMAMVKAFGYGGGALELSRLFAHEQVDYLGVAYADEGIELRQNGIRTPVMVMNPEPVPLELLHRFQLEPEVYHPASLLAAETFARTHADAPPIHLKLDTGMHRLGSTAADMPVLLHHLRDARHLKVASIFSHFAASEDPKHDDFTRRQIAAFRDMSEALIAVLGYRPLLHMANSGGTSRWPEAHFDMVRLGIGLHGIGVDPQETARLRPASTLRTPIAQIKSVPAGASIGYGRSHRTQHEQRIAILPIGYADGLSRRLGNGKGRVWIHGKAAPFAGTICMDMCMVDVTAIECREGDMAHVFDAQHPIGQYAGDLGTIPYEALTSISQRVKRVYVGG